MNIHYEKGVDYDAVVQLFGERYPRRIFLLVDPFFDETRIELKKDKIQYIFIIGFDTFWCKKNGILTLKLDVSKHADFASEWQKSRFQGHEISKFSGPPQSPHET